MKKKLPFLLMMLLSLTSCGGETQSLTSSVETPSTSGEVKTEWETQVKVPSTWALTDASAADIRVVEDAPELLIFEVVLDTHIRNREQIAVYEYMKVFNNTNDVYNLKNHRIALADPLSGQNGESAEAKIGQLPLVANYLYTSFITDDVIVPALSTALIWMKPYYWQAATGSTGATGVYDTKNVIQKSSSTTTVEDFKEFWKLPTETLVVEACSQPIVGTRITGTNEDTYPILSPGSGTPFSHLNSELLRSVEISKFDPNTTVDGQPKEVTYLDNGVEKTKLIYPAKLTIANEYKKMTEAERNDAPYVAGKDVFNAIQIKRTADDTVIDGYHFVNTWNYFKPVVRVNIHGRVDTTKLEAGTKVSFAATGGPGVTGWPTTSGLQFRPPLAGERIMQMQLPGREAALFKDNVLPSQLAVIRVSEVATAEYLLKDITVKVNVDPSTTVIDWRRDEIDTDARRSAACPGLVKLLNFSRN